MTDIEKAEREKTLRIEKESWLNLLHKKPTVCSADYSEFIILRLKDINHELDMMYDIDQLKGNIGEDKDGTKQ